MAMAETAPLVTVAVAVAWVVPVAVAMTPYCTQVPEPGTPVTPPVTGGVEQYLPRLAAVTEPLSTPTWLVRPLVDPS